jgi:hypothetical protein
LDQRTRFIPRTDPSRADSRFRRVLPAPFADGYRTTAELRRQVALTGFAMMLILILSQGYGARPGDGGSSEPAPQPPNAPSVPAVKVMPTDTSVLATTSAP